MDNNQLQQMMMQMMMQNNQMMSMLMAQMMPNTMAPATPTISIESQGSQTNAVAQIKALQEQVEALKSELQAARAETASVRKELSSTTNISPDVQELERVSGKSIKEVIESIKTGKVIVPRSGRGAHDAYKEMIDEGKLSKEVMYADSEDVLEAIEEVKNNGDGSKTVDELAEEIAEKKNKTKMVEFSDAVNEFGF